MLPSSVTYYGMLSFKYTGPAGGNSLQMNWHIQADWSAIFKHLFKGRLTDWPEKQLLI